MHRFTARSQLAFFALLSAGLIAWLLFYATKSSQQLEEANRLMTRAAELSVATVIRNLTPTASEPNATATRTPSPDPPTAAPRDPAASDIARAHQLTTEVYALIEDHFDRALLLATEAFRLADTPTTRGTLLFALQQNLNLSAILPHDTWGWAETVTFSPDGKLLAVSHTAGQISLYDLTLKPIEESVLVGLDTASGQVPGRTQVVFSPDGRYIAATFHIGADSMNEVAVWDSQSLELVATGPEGWYQFAFAADGEHLIGRDRTRVSSWKFAPGQPLEAVASIVIGDDSNLAYAPMAVHPLENMVAFGSSEGLVRFWDPGSGETVLLADERVNEPIVHLTFSPDGTTLAINTNSSLHLWSMAKHELIGTIQDVLPMVAFSQEGQKLLVAQRDESLLQLDITTLEPLTEPVRHWGATLLLTNIAMGPDGRHFASVYQTGEILLWQTDPQPRIGHAIASTSSPALFLDEETLLAVSPTGQVETWAITTGQLLDTTSGFAGESPPRFTFSADYSLIAVRETSNDATTITLYDANTQQILTPAITQSDSVYTMALNKTGTLLATGDQEGTLRIYDVPSGQLLDETFAADRYRIDAIAFSPDDVTIATIHRDYILLRETTNLASPLATIMIDADTIRFHPTEPILIAIGGPHSAISLWDSANGAALGDLWSDDQLIYITLCGSCPYAATAQMEYINYGSRLPYLSIHDWHTQSQVGPALVDYWLPGAFSPSGDLLASIYRGRVGNHIFIWNLQIDYWLDAICQTVNRDLTEAEWDYYVGDYLQQPACHD